MKFCLFLITIICSFATNNLFAQLSVTASQNSCDLIAVPSGGTAPYTYQWSGPSSGTVNPYTPPITVLGDYTVTVTDALNNTASAIVSYAPEILCCNPSF